MNIVDKLNYLMNKNNIKNVKTLANLANVPYTTLISIFKGDTPDIRLSTSKKLCDFLNITLDELLDDDIPLSDFAKNDTHVAASADIIDTSGLSDRTKAIINKLVNDFKEEENK